MKSDPLKLTPEVIAAINEELTYQAGLVESGRADRLDHGVEGQLVCLDTYTRKAQDAWALSRDEQPALDVLRKIAAIAARALILYGCPRRQA